MVVVLPAPFGPRNPRISPGLTEKPIPSTAARWPYTLVSPLTSIMTFPAVACRARVARITLAKDRRKSHKLTVHEGGVPYLHPILVSTRRGWSASGADGGGARTTRLGSDLGKVAGADGVQHHHLLVGHREPVRRVVAELEKR